MATSDRYQRDLDDLLSEVEGEVLLDYERKLIFLCFNIGRILPILLGLCNQLIRDVVTKLEVGPSLVGPAERMSAAIQDLVEINLSAQRAGRLDAPADRRLKQLRSRLARLLGRLKQDRGPDREQKLIVIHSNIYNILAMLERLRAQMADEHVDASDVGSSLIGATKQMLAAAEDLIELDRAFMVRRILTGPRPH